MHCNGDKMIKKSIYNAILRNTIVKNIAINLFINYFLNKQVTKIMNEYKNAPYCVKIENTNACNSRCIMCPHDKMKRRIGFMDWKLFEKVVDECTRLGVEHISLHGFGEPFLDKTFPEKVKYAKSKGIKRISTSTNASLLNADVATRLVDSGLDEIVISIDAATKETFEKIRIGLDYATVETNTINLVKIRDEKGSKKPFVVVDFVELNENKNDKNLFIKKWKNIADHVSISPLHNWGGKKLQVERVHKNVPYRVPCRLLWTDLVVNWDGTVPLCCLDTENEIILGNLNENTIQEIWKGEKLNNIRKKQIEGRFDEISMCRNCKFPAFWRWF